MVFFGRGGAVGTKGTYSLVHTLDRSTYSPFAEMYTALMGRIPMLDGLFRSSIHPVKNLVVVRITRLEEYNDLRETLIG